MRNDFPNLDLLRANAVLMVFISHLLSALNHFPLPTVEMLGFYGVLIFFVHTSLVLMMSLDRDYTANPARPLFLPFMIRRIFRIYPLAIVAVLVTFVFRIPLASLDATGFHYAERTVYEFLSNLFLLQNLTQVNEVPFVLWTLPYEMQMYLFLPLLSILCRRKRWSLLLIFSIAVLARLASHVPLPATLLGVSSFLGYVPYFIPGVIAFRIMKSFPPFQLPWWLWPPVIYAGILPLLLLPHLAPIAACFLIGLSLPYFRQSPAGIFAKSGKLVARYSYGIYLSHTFCIWFAFYRLTAWSAQLKWLIFILLAVLVPVLLYHTVEAPLIRVGKAMANSLFRTSETIFS